eukprot:scaffold489_cov259-Pinguiococcus_pyrenoidosus.AAC.38
MPSPAAYPAARAASRRCRQWFTLESSCGKQRMTSAVGASFGASRAASKLLCRSGPCDPAASQWSRSVITLECSGHENRSSLAGRGSPQPSNMGGRKHAAKCTSSRPLGGSGKFTTNSAAAS